MDRASFDAPEAVTQVLESTGYFRNGKPAPGVIAPASLRPPTDTDKLIRYAAVIKRLVPSAIYELSGAACFYFKWVDTPQPDSSRLADLHRLAWNSGLAPVLWVITPAKVLLYDCFSKPQAGSADSALIQTFENTASGLVQLAKVASKFQVESGEFWSGSRTSKINRKNRIDAALLRDISATEEQLIQAALTTQAAHGLITRSIFLAYLQDRKILNTDFLRAKFGHETLADILSTEQGAVQLFGWLSSTFNGDLFASAESPLDKNSFAELTAGHLEIVRNFLSGTEMVYGQRRFWPYDFSVIPVELISSIYEKFAYTGDSSVARQQSTHYTPVNLVDIVLSQVFSNPKHNARVLDMACGSGVFLVESLRRIVAQRVAIGEPWNRETIRRALYDQIFGVDINPEAIRIAMFSLYLTALELDPDPQPPSVLRFEPLIGRNLLIGDVFPDDNAGSNTLQSFSGKTFDVIVGNPPWSRRAGNRNPARYCEAKGLPLARFDTPDQAFLWRTLDFANAGTIVGLILHGKPFFSHTDDANAVRLRLVKSFKPRLLMNLAGLRQEGLFPKSTAPAMILVAQVGEPEKKATALLVAPRRDHTFRNHGIVEIEADDVREIDVKSIGSDQDFLKVASWGTPRDMQLVRRLRQYPSLGNLLTLAKHRGWAAGQGLQVAGGNHLAPGLEGIPFLQPGELTAFELDPRRLETKFGTQFLHRPRDQRIYRGPLVITPRGLAGPSFPAAFCKSDVVYSEVYYGIAIPRSEESYAHYLNAIFNSGIATYFLFITGSSWGVERDEVKPEDLLRLPVPKMESVHPSTVRDLLSVEKDLRSRIKPELLQALDDIVSKAYEIDEAERFLIDDFVQKTIPAWYTKSNHYEVATADQLQAYSDVTVRVIDALVSARGERKIVAEIISDTSSDLRVVRLRSVPKKQSAPRTRFANEASITAALNKISAALNEKHSGFSVRRVLRIYGDEDVYIVKPAEERYWTRSRALDDADAIIAEHLRSH